MGILEVSQFDVALHSALLVTMSANAAAADMTFAPGQKIVYTSVTTGKDFPGHVVDMYTDGGCQIRLDIDGGVKDLFKEDFVRLKVVEGIVADVMPAMTYSAPLTYSTAP